MQIATITAVAMLGAGAPISQAQTAPDHPSITIGGHAFTPQAILTRNMGSAEDQTTAFTPHRIIGNVYYVGTRTLSSFLIVTPAGNILIDSTYERNVRTIQKSVEQLGFKFSDIKILLGNHAHGDHQEGDALVKELTGAQVMAMAEDVTALKAIRPGGKEHPVDRILHDGDAVTLGGVTLVAHLTAGHTRGGTTWAMKVTDGGKSYDVVFYCSLRPPAVVTPPVAEEFNHSFAAVRALPCDVPLGDHPAEYDMQAKFAKLQASRPNPFIDPAGCSVEAIIEEAMFHAILDEQQKAPR
jgi:metallo-beta-lactamase class B